MAELITSKVIWKKGELGLQRFVIYESDGVAKRNLTGHTYTFTFWKDGNSTNEGSGSLAIVDALNGEAEYSVQASDTDTDGNFLGEIRETDTSLKTQTFEVVVLPSSPQ